MELLYRLLGSLRPVVIFLSLFSVTAHAQLTVLNEDSYFRQGRSHNSCKFDALVGKTADEVANKSVALNNSIAGQCFSSCTNPVTLESVDASVPSFDVRSDCTNQVFEIKIEKITSVKQCTKQHNKGNPCQISTGAKYAHDVEFADSPLQFDRSYNSLSLTNSGFGKGWHASIFKQLHVGDDTLYVINGNGRSEPWRKVDGVWQGDSDSVNLLVETPTGFTVTSTRGTISEYTLDGRMLGETDAQGRSKTYTYDEVNRLESVTNQYGLSLTFSYNPDNKISKISGGEGIEYQYHYDHLQRLFRVWYPDSNTNPHDNPRKVYHYENPDFPYHLTGITDENNRRYATYAYDAEGNATLTEYAKTTNAVGQERFELSY